MTLTTVSEERMREEVAKIGALQSEAIWLHSRGLATQATQDALVADLSVAMAKAMRDLNEACRERAQIASMRDAGAVYSRNPDTLRIGDVVFTSDGSRFGVWAAEYAGERVTRCSLIECVEAAAQKWRIPEIWKALECAWPQ